MNLNIIVLHLHSLTYAFFVTACSL